MNAYHASTPPPGVYIPEHYSGTAFRYPSTDVTPNGETDRLSVPSGGQAEESSPDQGRDTQGGAEKDAAPRRMAPPSRPTKSWREGGNREHAVASSELAEEVPGSGQSVNDSPEDGAEPPASPPEEGKTAGTVSPDTEEKRVGLPALLQSGVIGSEELLILGVALLILEEGRRDSHGCRSDVWIYLMLLLLL